MNDQSRIVVMRLEVVGGTQRVVDFMDWMCELELPEYVDWFDMETAPGLGGLEDQVPLNEKDSEEGISRLRARGASPELLKAAETGLRRAARRKAGEFPAEVEPDDTDVGPMGY